MRVEIPIGNGGFRQTALSAFREDTCASRDRLTGLLDRESFFCAAQQAIGQQTAGWYTLTSLDVESFKVINYQYGTEMGDGVLRHIADCLTAFTQAVDGLACRLTADQFVLLYPAGKDGEQALAETSSRIMNPACLNRGIRVRIGRYLVTDPSLPVSAMVDRADLAGASVKGRYDTYTAQYDSTMLDSLLQEQRIVSDMAAALRDGQFEPWFQPQYNHATGAMIGAEALVRWRKDGQLIAPGEFIPIFERSGFIYEMDQSIWRQVCALLRQWLYEGRTPLPVSVNISRYDILQEGFLDVICGLVKEYNLPVELLRLEITESAFSGAAQTLLPVVRELVDFGFTVELDDFGSGYSSLNTLKDVPASILKLDMRFLEDTADSKRGGSILESVVRMAKWLGMSVIAEGVEERVQADYMKSIGCYYIQGYYYARPMPAGEYEALQDAAGKEPRLSAMNTLDTLNSNEFWNPRSMETLIFNSYVGGASIIEYHNGVVEPIRANDRFTQEFGGAFKNGVPLAQLTPENCMDEANLRVMYDNIRKAIDTNRESTCEVSISGVDSSVGSVLFLRCTVRMIAWTADRQLLYCVVQNVTAQHLAEQRERDMYADLLDNLPCGAGLYSFDGRQLKVLHLNRQYWALVDRPAGCCDTIQALEALHPDDRDRMLPEIADALAQKRDAVCDVRIRCGERDYRRFHIVGRLQAKKEGLYSLYAFFIPATDNSLLLAEQNKSRREKDRLDFIFKYAAISVWSYNTATGEIIQNERSRSVHGFGAVVTGVPESLIDGGFVHPDSADDYRALYDKLKAGATEAEGVFRVRNADRSGYWFEHIRYAAIEGDEDAPELFFGISSDVSAEYEQENAIHQWMALLSEMQVENNAICEFNLTANTFVRKQGSLFPAFRFTRTDPFDQYVRTWARQCVYAPDADKVIDFLNRDKLLALHARGVLDGGIDYRAELGGQIKWCSLSIKFVEYPGDGNVRLIMVHTDINARKEDELRLIEENRRDALTGVLNRKAFERQVNEIITEDPGAAHALFMIDLDNFKAINDSFGHMTGDSVLQKTANGLKALLRSDDLVGRIGGDEFMVFLKNIPNREVIARRAEMILDMMHTVLDRGVQVSGSLGVAIAPRDGSGFDQLYRCADKAAYHSKQHGKNRVTFYEPDLSIDAEYGGTLSEIDSRSEAALKAWDVRIQQVMEENQRLIQRQEEDERYRLVIESTHILTFEWNAATGKFSASPEFDQYVLSNQGGEQLFSEHVDVSGIHPDDRALFYGKFLEKLLGGETVQETSLRLELKTGGYRWCRMGALVFFDKAERLQKAIGIITEENAQKKQSDIQLDAIFRFMSAGVLLLELRKPDITALYVSESYFRLENTNELTIDLDNPLHYVHPEDAVRLRDNLFICSISGAVMEETFRVVRSGRTLWRHMHAVRIPYPDAAAPVMIAVETDITDIKQHQEQLEQQQELIAAICDELKVVSWYYYPAQGRVVLNTVSALAYQAGSEAQNAPDCFVADGTIHPEDQTAFLALHQSIADGARTASAVIRVRRTDGSFEAKRLMYLSVPSGEEVSRFAIGVSQPAHSGQA